MPSKSRRTGTALIVKRGLSLFLVQLNPYAHTASHAGSANAQRGMGSAQEGKHRRYEVHFRCLPNVSDRRAALM